MTGGRRRGPGEARSVGRKILTFVAGATAVVGFVADYNRTHLFNPNWPPHARFHNAQTMTLGALLGTAGLVALYHGDGRPHTATTAGTLLPAAFWISMGASFLYPGTGGLQAEFPELVPRIGGVWIDERFGSAIMLGLGSFGYALERHRRGVRRAYAGRHDPRSAHGKH